MPRQTKESSFLERWRITDMEMWGQDYMDMEVKAFIEFEPGDIGHFQFGLVQGYMDCRFGERDGKSTAVRHLISRLIRQQEADTGDPIHARGVGAIGRAWFTAPPSSCGGQAPLGSTARAACW